jgi:hypothetical protein
MLGDDLRDLAGDRDHQLHPPSVSKPGQAPVRKIAMTLPEEQVAAARRAVAEGRSPTPATSAPPSHR